MAKYRIDVSEPAEIDLRDIVRYISSQLAAPETAFKMMETIEETIVSLADNPRKCPLVQDARLADMGYHKLIVKNYIVFYTIDESSTTVDVGRVLYARRDWRNIV